jgi:hypothetical protein
VSAILRAVAAGRVEITCSCEPNLFVDGLVFCDQYAARLLVHNDLIQQATPGLVGRRVPARLTAAAYSAISTVAEVA